uniref:hypothetical protein n=1 Tax=Bilophila wadsworthia TaxID=35833 RepID=UPI003FEEBDF7
VLFVIFLEFQEIQYQSFVGTRSRGTVRSVGRSALKAGRRWLETIALRAFFFAMGEMFFEVWMLSAWGGGTGE